MTHSKAILASDMAALNRLSTRYTNTASRYPVLYVAAPIVVIVLGLVGGLVIGTRFTLAAISEFPD